MMEYFPFTTMLNSRVGPEALAHRVAKVFGLDYSPGNRKIIDQENEAPNKKVVDEIKLLIDNSLPQDMAKRVERLLEPEKSLAVFEYGDDIEEGSGSNRGSDGGEHCVDKIEIVEETEYDERTECSHSYDRRCHISYVTRYVTQEKQVCKDNYKRDCTIKLEKAAINETVEVCRKALEKDCDEKGEEVCNTEYETECVTSQEHSEVDDDVPHCETVHEELCLDQTNGYTTSEVCNSWPKEVCSVTKRRSRKMKPVQSCHRVARNICGPGNCGVKEGPEECVKETVTNVEETPKESCVLDPVKTCKVVAELVPRLDPTEECVDVPKEVCTRVVTSPRIVKKPVVRQWCYNIV